MLLVTRLFIGIGEAGYGPAAQALIAEYHLIFQATAIALAIGGLIAAVTLRPLPRTRWR